MEQLVVAAVTCAWKMLPTGVEPVTLGLLDPRSNRLSYESTSQWPRVLLNVLHFCSHKNLRRLGIEPKTFAVLKRRHNQLDHACFSIKLHLGGNNRSLAAT